MWRRTRQAKAPSGTGIGLPSRARARGTAAVEFGGADSESVMASTLGLARVNPCHERARSRGSALLRADGECRRDQPTDDDRDRDAARKARLCTMRGDVAAAPEQRRRRLATRHAAGAMFAGYIGAFVFAVPLDARLRPCLGWLARLGGRWLDRAPGDEHPDHDRPPHAHTTCLQRACSQCDGAAGRASPSRSRMKSATSANRASRAGRWHARNIATKARTQFSSDNLALDVAHEVRDFGEL